MTDPPSPTVGAEAPVEVVGADEQRDVEVDVDRWCRLASDVLREEHRRGELTLTFVDRDEIAELNEDHLGQAGPTDVLSFPLDTEHDADGIDPMLPVLLGDVVICPAVALDQAPGHAGTLDDELALLVVHGVLHVIGHDHGEPEESALMRSRELELLQAYHWGAPAPASFRHEHSDP